jgi:transposase
MLNSECFCNLMDRFFLPFVNNNERLRIHHRLHMDNATPHRSAYTREYLNNNNINHVESPPESPNINPIDIVWNDLKNDLNENVKPNNHKELCNGIHKFWNTVVTVDYCNKKIDHIERVLKNIIHSEGKATGS